MLCIDTMHPPIYLSVQQNHCNFGLCNDRLSSVSWHWIHSECYKLLSGSLVDLCIVPVVEKLAVEWVRQGTLELLRKFLIQACHLIHINTFCTDPQSSIYFLWVLICHSTSLNCLRTGRFRDTGSFLNISMCLIDTLVFKVVKSLLFVFLSRRMTDVLGNYVENCTKTIPSNYFFTLEFFNLPLTPFYLAIL
jgi:hypothetical protein